MKTKKRGKALEKAALDYAKKPGNEVLSRKMVTELINEILAEKRKERIAKKKNAYEAKLWRNYRHTSATLVRFYKRQEERNKGVPYYDGSNLAEMMFEDGSILQLISKINDKLETEKDEEEA